MAVVTGLLTGALTKYLEDEDASDRLAANIIDGASNKYFNVTKPNADAEIKKISAVREAIVGEYGQNVADTFDSKGFFQKGDLVTTKNLIDNYLQKFGETDVSYKKKVDKFAKDNPEEFKRSFGITPTASRITQLQDRDQHVQSLFKDRSNIRDLLIAPGTKQKGISGLLFGDRIDPSQQIQARARLEGALDVEAPSVSMPTAAPEEMFGLQVATPRFSTNNLNKEVGTRLAINAPMDQYGNITLQPEAQRLPEVNAVKDAAVNFMKQPGFRTAEGTGNETLAVQAATKYIQDNVEIPMQQNFTGYRKTVKGFETVKGAATGVAPGLTNKANAYAIETGDESLSNFDRVVQYIVNNELSKLVDNPSAIKYYISLIPESVKSPEGVSLKQAVQIAYNLDLSKAR